MYYNSSLTSKFESEKNKKALAFTTLICGLMFLMAVLVSWQLPTIEPPAMQDMIEINLGNYEEGTGTIQPLIKGEKAPAEQIPEQKHVVVAKVEPVKDINTDDTNDKDAAPVTKTEKITPKVIAPAPVIVPVPKPQKPKIAGYSGPSNGTGNGATEDNGYRYQGNNPNGKGDAGNPNGKPDSYGNNPGGRTGGTLRVSKGDRTIVNNYIFMGDLPKATINAIIKVSPEGRGVFVTLDKGSTSSEARYANAIRNYLPNIIFNRSDHESIVTVPFNFKVQ